MRYLQVKVYKYDVTLKSTLEVSGPVNAVLYKDQILFLEDFKTSKVKGQGFYCNFHIKPPLASYGENFNLRIDVIDQIPQFSFLAYAHLNETEMFDMKMMLEKYWIAQPKFWKDAIVPLLSGWIGGTVAFLIQLLISKTQ